jgi:hypothetical protein
MIAAGVVAFVFGVLGSAAREAWGILLVNTVFFLGIAQCGVVISAILTATVGNWGRSISRIAEGLGSFLPIAFVLVALILLFGSHHLYRWIDEPIEHNKAWLNLPFMTVRDLLLLGILLVMSLRFVYLSLRPDLYLARDKVSEKNRGLYERLTANFRGVEAELERTRRTHRWLSVLIILCWAVFFSVLAFDLLMSLDPEWASTLFGAFFFMGTLYTGWCTVWLISAITRERRGLGDYITTQQFHDLGKLTFSWCMAWCYLFWSQFLPIWYGNMWEETHYVLLRVHGFWQPLAYTVLAMCFIVPFFGMLRKQSKTTPVLIYFFSAVILAGMFLERYLLVFPDVTPDRMPVGFVPIGVSLGVLGLFMLAYGWFTATFPILPLARPPIRALHHVESDEQATPTTRTAPARAR